MSHHSKSIHLFKRISELDLEGYFDFKCGGDGDNGEMLMDLLDIYFAEQEQKESNVSNATLR